MDRLPPNLPGTALRILATTDLAAAFTPVPTSYGESGTCAGLVELLTDQRDQQPTIWLDAGDLAVGPVQPLLGRRPWAELAELPISAAAAGNHEFDDGVPALSAAARLLPYPMLCANVDVGLPAAAMVDSVAGPVGVIGLTHPYSHLFSQAPPPAEAWPDRVGRLADELRADGARWVVVLLHDGVDWWPRPDPSRPTGCRSDRLAAVAEPWAAWVDLILGGHTDGAWTGRLAGTPAGHAHNFASSVLVVDLPVPPREPVVRGVFPVPAVRPANRTPAVDALDAAAATVRGESRFTWVARTGVEHYLPDLVARALRTATGAPAAFVPAGQHATQGPLDGAAAALRAGPVTQLDLTRLFGSPDDRPAIVPLRPGELRAAVAAYDAVSHPYARDGDGVWWNWGRMPAGVSTDADDPTSVAVMPFVVPRLGELLRRDLGAEDAEVAEVSAREALLRALDS